MRWVFGGSTILDQHRSTEARCRIAAASGLSFLSILYSSSAETAAGAEQLAGDPFGVVRGQKRGNCGDVIHLANAAKWSLGHGILLKRRTNEAGSVHSFGLDHPWVNGVDANLARAQLFRQNPGNNVHRALGARVNRAGRRRQAADHRTDVDDAGSVAEVGHGSLGREQESQHVDVEDLVKLLLGHGLDGGELVNAGVVDQDVEAAEVLDGSRYQTLGVRGFRYVSSDGDCLAPAGGYRADHGIFPRLSGGVGYGCGH